MSIEYNDNLAEMSDGGSFLSSFAVISTDTSSNSDNEVLMTVLAVPVTVTLRMTMPAWGAVTATDISLDNVLQFLKETHAPVPAKCSVCLALHQTHAPFCTCGLRAAQNGRFFDTAF